MPKINGPKQLKDVRGRLTAYGLACGYTERRVRGNVESTLWADAGTYHVRGWDFVDKKRTGWESFPKLREARAHFDKQGTLER